MTRRIICDTVLVFLIIWAPWYIVLSAILVFSFLLESYWEGVAAGLVMDSFYSLPGNLFWGGFGFFSALAIFFSLISLFIRDRMRVYT